MTPLHQLAIESLSGHRRGSTHQTYTSDLGTEWTRYTMPGQSPILGISTHPQTHRRAIRAAHVHLYPNRGPRLRTRPDRAISRFYQGDPCTTHLALHAVQRLPRATQERAISQMNLDMSAEEIGATIERLDQMMEQQPTQPGKGCVHTSRQGPPYSPGAVLEQRLIFQRTSLAEAALILGWRPALLDEYLTGSRAATAMMNADLERLTAIPAMGWDLMRLLANHHTVAA